ncbi:hypothetical protein [Aerococcus sp. Group 1]|uniref:hypothetical protein n=1 Tax=Aerococcus urinae (strain CCUG 59500 / ACS-120-V-Col10a) TaxID=2976812 RepID=UPI0006749957|nr:hypothetical protein [Aerococcus sp. Group 1]
MRIVFLRSNAVNPDSRVEKEVASLLKGGHEVSILAWDRESEIDSADTLKFNQFNAPIYRFGIKSEFGAGFKKIFYLFQNFRNVCLTGYQRTKISMMPFMRAILIQRSLAIFVLNVSLKSLFMIFSIIMWTHLMCLIN